VTSTVYKDKKRTYGKMSDVIELKFLLTGFFFLELDSSRKKSHLYENTHGHMYRVKRRRTNFMISG